MAQDIAQQLTGKFINMESGEAVSETGSGVYVDFFMEAEPDQLLTEGGYIAKSHPRVKEIRRLEQDALELLRKEQPFGEEAPEPPKDRQNQALMKQYDAAFKEWEARKDQYDSDQREMTRLLTEPTDDKLKDQYLVKPAGRPIYVDREFIRKIVPGDKDNIPVRPVRESDIVAYRDQYNRFKAGLAQQVSGTPLAQLPGMSKAQIKDLEYFNVRTIEQLVGTSDAQLTKIGPYMALRNKAKDYLATARGMAPVEEARAEAKRAREELADLKRQIEQIRKAQQTKN